MAFNTTASIENTTSTLEKTSCLLKPGIVYHTCCPGLASLFATTDHCASDNTCKVMDKYNRARVLQTLALLIKHTIGKSEEIYPKSTLVNRSDPIN